MVNEIAVIVFALGPIVWVALTCWIVVRQVKKSRLRLHFFLVAIVIQIVLITLPFIVRYFSVEAAGLSEFTSCPNNQEYCDEIWELADIDAKFFFLLGLALWVGIALWLLTFFRIPRQADV